MRNITPVKYYKDEGFVEHKIEIVDEDLEAIIEEYLMRHAEFDFDEVEIVNNRPMNIWLYAKCRKYLDPDAPEEDQVVDAEVEVPGEYDWILIQISRREPTWFTPNRAYQFRHANQLGDRQPRVSPGPARTAKVNRQWYGECASRLKHNAPLDECVGFHYPHQIP